MFLHLTQSNFCTTTVMVTQSFVATLLFYIFLFTYTAMYKRENGFNFATYCSQSVQWLALAFIFLSSVSQLTISYFLLPHSRDDMRLIYPLSRLGGNTSGKTTVLLRHLLIYIVNRTFHNKITHSVHFLQVYRSRTGDNKNNQTVQNINKNKVT